MQSNAKHRVTRGPYCRKCGRLSYSPNDGVVWRPAQLLTLCDSCAADIPPKVTWPEYHAAVCRVLGQLEPYRTRMTYQFYKLSAESDPATVHRMGERRRDHGGTSDKG